MSKVISNDAEIQSCVSNHSLVEIWVSREFDAHCRLVEYNDQVVRTSDGFYYLRTNIKMRLTSFSI